MGHPTHARLLELLQYDLESGEFTRLVGVRGYAAGTIAGCLTSSGYVVICIDRRNYGAHQLAWFYVTGEWPVDLLDHRDLNKSNNRFDNLRLATNQQNMANRGKNKNNTSGLKGVSFDNFRGKWKAQIMVNRKNVFLGRFPNAEQAHEAYVVASRKYFGEFAAT